jgi:hypothetical protein
MTGTAARPHAPWVVFVACWLLGGVAAVQVIAGIGDFYAIPEASRYYADAARNEAAGQARAVGLVLLAVFSFIVAVVYLVLAILDALGMSPARVITWVVAGLTVVVSTIALIVGGYGRVPWYHRMASVLTAVTLVFAATSVLLLASPSARVFYRSTHRPVPARPGPYPNPYARPPVPYPGPQSWPGQPGPRPPEPPSAHPGSGREQG